LAVKRQRLAVLERDQLARVQANTTEFQARVDDALAPYNVRAPSPVAGENETGYSRRLIQIAQERLPSTHPLYKVALGDMDASTLTVFADQILDAAKASAWDPSSVPRGTIAQRNLDDPYTGQRSVAFVGQESFIKSMSMPPRKLKRLIDPKSGRVLIGPDSPTIKLN
jgi:hypothetical protein